MNFLKLIILIWGILFSPLLIFSQDTKELECFMIMAGKDATTDGSVLLAHNNDLRGNNASLFKIIPGESHQKGDKVEFTSGLKIPQADETYRWLALQIHRGFAAGDAKAVNEHQVAIAGGVALGGDRNERAAKADPMVEKGLPGGIRYVVLERSKTARDAVELLGEKYSKYGITYPSGVGIADPNEVWYIEAGGGRSWAAVRVPDDAVWVQANGYRIQEIDPDDIENVILSRDLLKFAKENELWDPTEGPFNFAKAFGRGRLIQEGREYYDTRRVWGALRMLAPSMDWDPNTAGYPMFITPEDKVSVQKMMKILRDHYRGTEYDIFSSAGSEENERAIAVPNCVHTSVIQLRNWLPSDIGAVLWGGLGSPLTTTYIPYYFATEKFHKAYKTAGPDFNPHSAFWIFRTLQNLATPYYNQLSDIIESKWGDFETGLFNMQRPLENVALELYEKDPELARNFLTNYSYANSLKALDIASQLAEELHTEISIISR